MSTERDRRRTRAAAPAGDVATAALALWGVVMLFGLVRTPAASEGLACREPAELAAVAGWTSRVGCAVEPAERAPLRGPARLLFGLPLDLNHAQARTLEVLPRIGPVRAAAIVRARDEMRFETPADLLRVRGIGPRTFDGLRDRVSVSRTR